MQQYIIVYLDSGQLEYERFRTLRGVREWQQANHYPHVIISGYSAEKLNVDPSGE